MAIRRAAACENWFSGISAIPVQVVVALGANDPNDGIRAPVRRGHDRRSPTSHRRAPSCRKGRRSTGPNLERRQVSRATRTIRSLALERHKDAVRRWIGGRSSADRTHCDGFGG